MRRRLLPVVLAVAVVATALVLFIVLRRKGPPEAARLLPDADGVVYIDVELLRKLGVFSRVGQAPEDPAYQDFLRSTDFHFERDLDEAAFALHAPAPPETYPRFSEVFVGRYKREEMTRYLARLANVTEQYRDTTIYSVPHEGRTVRVALLGANLAAASNTPDAAPIHAIIDQYRRVALPFRGPTLLASEYARVPFASLVWAIIRVAPAPPQAGPGLAAGVLRDLAPGAVLAGSLRFTTRLELRVEADTSRDAEATRMAENVGNYLELFRSIEANVGGGTDPDIKAAVDSLRVEHEARRATLRADIPLSALKKLAAEPPAVVRAPPTQTPAHRFR
jgi:hypothetical protein